MREQRSVWSRSQVKVAARQDRDTRPRRAKSSTVDELGQPEGQVLEEEAVLVAVAPRIRSKGSGPPRRRPGQNGFPRRSKRPVSRQSSSSQAGRAAGATCSRTSCELTTSKLRSGKGSAALRVRPRGADGRPGARPRRDLEVREEVACPGEVARVGAMAPPTSRRRVARGCSHGRRERVPLVQAEWQRRPRSARSAGSTAATSRRSRPIRCPDRSAAGVLLREARAARSRSGRGETSDDRPSS